LLGNAQEVHAEARVAAASSAAPNDGATMAFDFEMVLAGIELDFAMEMYAWPCGNAGVTVTF